MAGAKVGSQIQLGRETTPGTAVAATTIWRGVGGNLKDERRRSRLWTSRLASPSRQPLVSVAGGRVVGHGGDAGDV